MSKLNIIHKRIIPVIYYLRWLLSNIWLYLLSFIVLIGFSSSREDHAVEPHRPGGAVVGVPPIHASYQLLFLKLSSIQTVLSSLNIFKCRWKRQYFLQEQLVKGYFIWNVIKLVWISGQWACLCFVSCPESCVSWHPLPTFDFLKWCLEWMWFLEKQMKNYKAYLILSLPSSCLCILSFDS